jgi:hypothetical protein
MTREERDEIRAIWERLDTLEEMVNLVYDKLDIVFEGESAEEVIEGSDA